jgi:hypothetical protein
MSHDVSSENTAKSGSGAETPVIAKIAVGLLLLYLMVGFVAVTVTGAATGTPVEGLDQFKMYLTAGVVIALASGLYKMQKASWWFAVIAAGLRLILAGLGLVALFVMLVGQDIRLEPSGMVIFYAAMIAVSAALLAAIFVLLLSRRGRQAYKIGRYAEPRAASVPSRRPLQTSDLPSVSTMVQKYPDLKEEIEEAFSPENIKASLSCLQDLPLMSDEALSLRMEEALARPWEYTKGIVGIYACEMCRREAASGHTPEKDQA